METQLRVNGYTLQFAPMWMLQAFLTGDHPEAEKQQVQAELDRRLARAIDQAQKVMRAIGDE